MIRRAAKGKYVLYSSDGSRGLSKPGTLEQARKRERQVQYFKHLKTAKN